MNHHQNALEALAQLSHVAGLIDTAECKDEGLYNRLQSALAVSNAALDDAMKALAAAPQVVAEERAAFEADVIADPECGYSLAKSNNGDYLSASTNAAWAKWKARAAAPVQAQEPVEFKDTPFGQHLEKCAKEVAAWPSWKRDMYGNLSAPVQPVAVPDGDLPTDPSGCTGYLAGMAFGNCPADEIGHCVSIITAALPAPAAQGDAKDSERLRMLLENDFTEEYSDYILDCLNERETVDFVSIIDAAIAAKAAS